LREEKTSTVEVNSGKGGRKRVTRPSDDCACHRENADGKYSGKKTEKTKGMGNVSLCK